MEGDHNIRAEGVGTYRLGACRWLSSSRTKTRRASFGPGPYRRLGKTS